MDTRGRKKMAQLYRRTAVLPLSGDPLSDWLFSQFVDILRTEQVRVARKKRLVNPDDPHRRVIRGLMDPDVDPAGNWVQILINPAKNTHGSRDEEVETLIHELSHALLPKTQERSILRVERILTRRFTRDQRNILKAFLPKHQIKRYPKMFVGGRPALS
jgi:hypothetical protein